MRLLWCYYSGKKNARPSPTPLLPCMPTMALRDRLRRIQAHTSLSDDGRSVLEKEAGREDPFWPQTSDGNFRHCRSVLEFFLLRSFVPSSTQSRTHHPTVAITVLLLCSGWHFFSHLLSGSECHATRPAAMTKTGFLKRRWRSSTPRRHQQHKTTRHRKRDDTTPCMTHKRD
mgnify:CR=1 FL=1